MNVRRLASSISALLIAVSLIETAPAAAAVSSEPGRVRWRLQLAADYSLHSPGVGPDGTVPARTSERPDVALRAVS